MEPIYYDYEYLTHSYLHVTHKIFNNSNVGEGDLVQHSKVALTRIKKGRPTSKIRLYSTDKEFLQIFQRKIKLSIDQRVRIYLTTFGPFYDFFYFWSSRILSLIKNMAGYFSFRAENIKCQKLKIDLVEFP